MKDDRDPEIIGKALAQLKVQYPNLSAAERADQLEKGYLFISMDISTNGSK